jgi:hypothetical protein
VTIHEVATAITRLVEANLPQFPGVPLRDTNDEQLCVAYGRSFRCFVSIRELAGRDAADDALVLTRTLLMVALRSLYMALPNDPVERELRFRSSGLTSMKAEITAADDQTRAGFTSVMNVDPFRAVVSRLEGLGVPQLPPEEQIAERVGFGPFYSRVFRPASAVAHYSIWSALDGYARRERPAVIALELPAPERAVEALTFACVVYAAFLEKCDPIIGHGVTSRAREVLDEYVRGVDSTNDAANLENDGA